jgi:hypothetical protein
MELNMTEGAGEKRKLTEFSSFMGDLPSVAQKFWDAVAGPVFELSISLIVVFFALGGDKQVEDQISAQVTGISPPQIDVYGIKAVIPIAVLILLLGIAQGNSKLLRVIGAAIPGQLVPNRRNLLMRNAAPLEIGESWQYNPILGSIDQLNTEIDATIGRVPVDQANDILSEVRIMQSRSDLLASTAAFIKGLFVVTIGIVVVLNVFGAWPIHWRHLAVIFAISSIALVYLAFCRIQAEREYARRKVKDYNFQKKMLNNPPPPPDHRHQARLNDIDQQAAAAKTESSWTLKLVPPDVKGDLRTLGNAMISFVKR